MVVGGEGWKHMVRLKKSAESRNSSRSCFDPPSHLGSRNLEARLRIEKYNADNMIEMRTVERSRKSSENGRPRTIKLDQEAERLGDMKARHNT